METTEPKQGPHVTTWHGEGRSLFYIVAPWADGPLASFSERSRADFVVDLLGVVGSRDFLALKGDPVEVALAVEALTVDPDLDPEEVLAQASDLLGGFGVEHVGPVVPEGRTLAYVNAGDTYAGTLAHDGTAYVVTSWGDFVEAEESARAEETLDDGEPEARCGYCGEWGDASTRSTCCGGYHADGSPSGFHSCASCGKCSACGASQVAQPDDFDAVLDGEAWADVLDLPGEAVPFDDVRADSPDFVLDGKPSPVKCPECKGHGATSRRPSPCPTCRGACEVVPWGEGFLGIDGLARLF